jgi:uncharacterized protein YbaA (DUF1428 family)
MMSYVDGFVIPVPRNRLATYRKLASQAAKTWLKHGALSYVESVADDVKPGKPTSFPLSIKLKSGEVVVFSWITYKSRKHRDRVNAKVMKDPFMANFDFKNAPFDVKRMLQGGFKKLVAM